MPESLPPYLISASIFLCQYTLSEDDGVSSAIRIIDIFLIQPEAPEGSFYNVQAFACAILKAVPRHLDNHSVEFKILNTSGKFDALGEPVSVTIKNRPELADAPGGLTINAQLNLSLKVLGTYYVCLFVDGRELARTPLTVLRRPDKAQG